MPQQAAHGSAFYDELTIVGGTLQVAKGPLNYYKDMPSIAFRIVQIQDLQGTGAMAAAAGRPDLKNTNELSRFWEMTALEQAGEFVEGPAQASAVALVVLQDGSERLIEWSHDLQLTH
jgi:hypothetical protein